MLYFLVFYRTLFVTEGMRFHVRHGVDLVLYFESLLEGDDNFEVVCPVSLITMMCFRWKGGAFSEMMTESWGAVYTLTP